MIKAENDKDIYLVFDFMGELLHDFCSTFSDMIQAVLCFCYFVAGFVEYCFVAIIPGMEAY